MHAPIQHFPRGGARTPPSAGHRPAAADTASLAPIARRMNAGPHAASLSALQSVVAQRVCADCEHVRRAMGGAQPVQRAAKTANGLPDGLRAGLESLSGRDLSGVTVNYDSPKPAQLNAHAFAQGSTIHVAPGQEKHLPHEGWHAVQQMAGRVRPTMDLGGTPVNDDAGLEREADVMGARAARAGAVQRAVPDGAPEKTGIRGAPAGVAQRTLRVNDDGESREFDGFDSVRKAPPERLKALEDRYFQPDFARIVNQLDDWAGEFDAFPDAGEFAGWPEAVQAAASALKITPLQNPGQAELLTDPERTGPAFSEQKRRFSIGEQVGSPAYWSGKLKMGRQESGEVVLAGHGYRKPWETDVVTVPDGTRLEFYVLDDEGLPEQDAIILQNHGTKHERVGALKAQAQDRAMDPSRADDGPLRSATTYKPGDAVYNYTLTPPRADDQMPGTFVPFSNRRKLSEILAPELGVLHLAVCREIDWWGSFSEMDGGDIHQMPEGWKYVRAPRYKGYLGPQMQSAPGSGITEEQMAAIRAAEKS